MSEAVALEHLVGNVLTTMENNQLQFKQGFLSNEHWRRNRSELHCMLTVPLFREIAANWDFRDSFKEVISDALREIRANEENCWSYEDWDFPMN
jgi:hypothetical protein